MFQRVKKAFLLPGLLLGIVLPYLLAHDNLAALRQKVSAFFVPDAASGQSSSETTLAALAGRGGTSGNSAASNSSSLHPPISDLGEILRFDVSPRWVLERWPRVSTTLGNMQLDGYRVAVVTGTQPDDLAGSLTYYFNTAQQVERVTFSGFTGDERKLVAFVMQYYGLTIEPAVGTQLFLKKWNGTPLSALRVALAPVVNASSPHGQRLVLLELNRPQNYARLSPEFATVLQGDLARR